MLLKTIRGIWDRAGVPKLGQTRTEREAAEQCEGGKPQADSVEVKPLGSGPTVLHTSLPPSYFLQDCAQHETSRTPRAPRCKLLSFNFILSLVDFLLHYLLLPSNKLKVYRNVKKIQCSRRTSFMVIWPAYSHPSDRRGWCQNYLFPFTL